MNTLIALMLCFTLLVQQEYSKKTHPRVKKVILKSVDLDIETPIHITTATIEKYLASEIRTDTICDAKKIEYLKSIIDNLQKDPQNYLPDVRALLLVFYSNSACDTIALSNLGVEKNGKSFLQNIELVEFVKGIREDK